MPVSPLSEKRLTTLGTGAKLELLPQTVNDQSNHSECTLPPSNSPSVTGQLCVACLNFEKKWKDFEREMKEWKDTCLGKKKCLKFDSPFQ